MLQSILGQVTNRRGSNRFRLWRDHTYLVTKILSDGYQEVPVEYYWPQITTSSQVSKTQQPRKVGKLRSDQNRCSGICSFPPNRLFQPTPRLSLTALKEMSRSPPIFRSSSSNFASICESRGPKSESRAQELRPELALVTYLHPYPNISISSYLRIQLPSPKPYIRALVEQYEEPQPLRGTARVAHVRVFLTLPPAFEYPNTQNSHCTLHPLTYFARVNTPLGLFPPFNAKWPSTLPGSLSKLPLERYLSLCTLA